MKMLSHFFLFLFGFFCTPYARTHFDGNFWYECCLVTWIEQRTCDDDRLCENKLVSVVCMWWDYCNCVLNVRLFNLQNPCSKVGHFEDFSLKFRQWKKRLIQCGCGFTFNTSVKRISQYQKLINQFWEILRPLKKYFKSNFLKDFIAGIQALFK